MGRPTPSWGAAEAGLRGLGKDANTKPPSQTWRRFLENHVGCLASMDLFVVPTAAFRLLYGFIILRPDRRRIVHFGVTEHPTSIWIAR